MARTRVVHDGDPLLCYALGGCSFGGYLKSREKSESRVFYCDPLQSDLKRKTIGVDETYYVIFYIKYILHVAVLYCTVKRG